MADSTTVVIAFRSEFLSLKDAEGKALTTDAALFLSQVVWLSEHKADEQGWFEWATETCTKQTGLSRRQQDVVRKQLSNYLQRDRRGLNGGIVYRLCRNPLHSEEQPVALRGATEANPLHIEEQPVAHRGATEAPAVSTQDTKTNSKTSPLYIPPEEGAKSGKSTFVPPTLEIATAFIVEECRGSIADADNFFDHFTANGWLMGGRAKMKDWKAAARKWVRQSVRWEEERNVRGSPVAARNGQGSYDMSLKQRADHIERLFEDL